MSRIKIRLRSKKRAVRSLVFSLTVYSIIISVFYLQSSTRQIRANYGNIDFNSTFSIDEGLKLAVIHQATIALPNETAFCIYGRVEGKKLVIDDVYRASMKSSSPIRADFDCPLRIDYLGSIHSHPTLDCSLSQTDVFNFAQNKHFITGIVCGETWLSTEYDAIVLYNSIDDKTCCNKILQEVKTK